MADETPSRFGFGSSTMSAEVFAMGQKLADLMGRYVDEPNLAMGYSNPTYSLDPRFREFHRQLEAILPPMPSEGPIQYGVAPQQFGFPQNPPQYRGIRFILPKQSGGEYARLANYPTVPGFEAINQAFLGEMIRRGYPVLGGVGQMPGFEPGFNPVGFGQR